ncbi:hypothetical protein ACTXT7_009665 [Hymenolepis weldensis]
MTLKEIEAPRRTEMSLAFFPTKKTATRMKKDLRVNTDADAYVETIQTIVIEPPWIDNVANGGRLYVFQQDPATSHKALKTPDGMAENFHQHAERGVVEKEVNKHLHSIRSSSLMEAIARTMENINNDHLIKACNRFRTRTESDYGNIYFLDPGSRRP